MTGTAAAPAATRAAKSSAQHVLLLSIDGMHQSDLAYYVHNHPHSAMAAMVHNGLQYTKAQTQVP